jgi:hypothetical protein
MEACSSIRQLCQLLFLLSYLSEQYMAVNIILLRVEMLLTVNNGGCRCICEGMRWYMYVQVYQGLQDSHTHFSNTKC